MFINKDIYNLNRFIKAQADIYESVLSELKNGHKTSHWMWFIFPQIKGLGNSTMSVKYAVNSFKEAEEYLNHPLLGKRIKECTDIVLNLNGYSAKQIFGSIDEMKLRSSMTMFNAVQQGENIFKLVLDKYFKGLEDQRSLELLINIKKY